MSELVGNPEQLPIGYRVDSQDREGKWWPGADVFVTRLQAVRSSWWADCPTRVVEVTEGKTT